MRDCSKARQNLVSALALLQNLWVDLNNVQAVRKERSFAHRGELKYHVYSDAAQLVVKPNQRADAIQ
jgi:hypothetical protein